MKRSKGKRGIRILEMSRITYHRRVECGNSYELPSHPSRWFLSMLRIFQLSDIKSKRSLPPVRNWRLNSDIFVVAFVLAMLALVVLFIKPAFTGYISVSEMNNYTEYLGLEVNESSSYSWSLMNEGDLKRVSIDARFSGDGFAKVYLRHNDVDYLVFDSSQEENGLAGVTGFAVLNESVNETNQTEVNGTLAEQVIVNMSEINISEHIQNLTVLNETLVNTSVEDLSIKLVLDYYNESNYDTNNDGVETIDGIVDLTVKDTEFNFDVNLSNLCTRWTVNDVDEGSVDHVCYGSNNCCSFIGLESDSSKWDDVYYSYFEMNGAGYENIISAQIVYAYYDFKKLEAEVAYSGVSNKNVKFSTPKTEINDFCLETCLLPGLNASSYFLIFEVENGTLEIESVSYTVGNENVVNNAPKLVKNISDVSIVDNYTINLSKYFFDDDGDVLAYSYYETEGISVEIDDDIAVISASELVGVRSMFFIANDSSLVGVSNVFKVSVGEAEVIEVKPKVVIGKPVKWVKRVKQVKGVAKVNVTKGAFNISVKDVTTNVKVDESKIKVVEDNRVKGLEEYETEKKDKRKPKERNFITGAVIGLASSEEENVTEIIIEEVVEEVEVEYYTEGPTAEEIIVSDYKKRIVVSSDIHYEDILSYTELPVEAEENAVRLYWLVNGSRQEVDIDKFDTNNNSLIDYIEWI
ncbi:MAG: hypothetical protein QF362_02490, partial [Candidatus Woesearchaeota archaeon]|nr:hypothetical protein [Candidatus Woesearchaeota archaeon]